MASASSPSPSSSHNRSSDISLPGTFADAGPRSHHHQHIAESGLREQSSSSSAYLDASESNGGGSSSSSSSNLRNALQRPSLPLRALSSSAAMADSTSLIPPASPALSDSRVEDDQLSRSVNEGVANASTDSFAPMRSRRADMDRIKSRAVDSASWNWETEKAKVEAAGAASGSGAMTPNSEGPAGSRQSTMPPVAPPRHSSRPVPAQGRPRIDTSGTAGPPESGGNQPSPQVPSVITFPQQQQQQQPAVTASSRDRAAPVPASRKDQLCDACGKPMTGQFVRALGVVFHLDCFRCRDCHKVVASKFFPATEEMKGKDSSSPRSSTGGDDEKQTSAPRPQKLFPLCETDYFRRLDLLCAKCAGALRGSYITALGKKFHVEHFTCSVCPTVFGPQDSYYEHDGKVFCHFHYSTRFAIKCTGCRTAILKQFVEINRNNQDEHWHPECYMIHKFWNIKLCPTGQTPKDATTDPQPSAISAPQPSNHGVAPVNDASATDEPSAEALETEATETPSSLKQKQKIMEEQVYRIWTVLSAFEESSAACISEMLRHVSSGRYLGGVRMAERFILHVEILFSAIDDIERAFRKAQAKGVSHIREARMLCKKIVNFFSLLSHTQETGARRMGITQELLSLVTGLAHYLKILIRITLTGALKLSRDHDNHQAIEWFLDQLAYLASVTGDDKTSSNGDKNGNEMPSTSQIVMQGRDGRWYGYRSLPRSTSTTSSDGNEGATDLCVSCGQTVEEECVRMGINMRWHASCLRCTQCKRRAHKESSSNRRNTDPEKEATEEQIPTLPAAEFALEITSRQTQADEKPSSRKLYITYCAEHAPTGCRRGFETGTRLEQYAFLLRVALNRLYALLKKRGVVPASPPPSTASELPSSTSASTIHAISAVEEQLSAYQDSTDIKRMKSVNLDRKLSTKAKVPRISTVVGSPSGQQTLTSSVQQKASPTSTENLHKTSSPKEAEQPPQQPFRSRSPANPLRRSPSPGALSRGHHPQQRLSPRSRDASPAREPGSVFPVRPAFARHNTDVRIREDGPMRQPSGDDHKDALTQAEEGLTLGDIPQLLEAEQAREQHRVLHHEGGRSLSELSALELFIVKHMAVMVLQQSPLKDLVPMDDLIDFIEMRKNTFWGKLFKSGKDKKKVEKKGVFGIPLEILVEKSGADSTLGASTTHLRVPSFIDDIISAMKQMDVSVEGIFRKNGNIRRLKELSEALDRDSSAVNLLDDNPVQLAALLKKFLRELPDPLLTFKLHRLFVMSQKLEPEAERLRVLHLVTLLLPKAHRDTLEVLFVFLKWVASFSHVDEETGSKMDLQNLAMVLGPNILYAKSQDPAKDELFLANRAILCLLENQDEFWMVPSELEAVLQDRELLSASSDLTSRDILKRCEKYAKQRHRGQGGQGMPGNPDDRGRGDFGGSGPGAASGEMHFGSRQQRPEYHDPVTMRQAESRLGGGASQYSLNGGGGMTRSGSSHPFSPVDGPSGADRPPWVNGGAPPQHYQQQQHPSQQQQQRQYQNYSSSASGHTPYGSPDRSHQANSGSWGIKAQQRGDGPNSAGADGLGGVPLSANSSSHQGLPWHNPSRQQSA